MAHWLGHQDGGKLRAERYAHLNRDHARAQAKKLNGHAFVKNSEPTASGDVAALQAQVAALQKQLRGKTAA